MRTGKDREVDRMEAGALRVAESEKGGKRRDTDGHPKGKVFRGKKIK
jgi:hypothetical protein